MKETKDYSGADIEAVIKETIEKAFIKNAKSITTNDVLKEIKGTEAMKVTLKEKIESMMESIKKFKFKDATEKDKKNG